MKQLVFANFIIILKKYSNNPAKAYQFFLTDLFDYLINFSKDIFVESNVSSRIMTRQYDVPNYIRDLINSESKIEIQERFNKFINEKMNLYKIEALIKELKDLINLSSNLKPKEKENMKSIHETLSFLTTILFFTIRVDNRIKLKQNLWHNGVNSIDLITGDLMSLSFNAKEKEKEKIVIIPFDTNYHLHVSSIEEKYPEVSKETLHGKWLLKMQNMNYTNEKIKSLIEVSNKYNNGIGSIGKLLVNKVLFYLVGLSKFDENNKVPDNRNIEDIKICINNILDEYNNTGQGVPLYIPLLGTGRSRFGLSYDESIQIICEECIKNKIKIQGKINILVYNKNLEEMMEVKDDLQN